MSTRQADRPCDAAHRECEPPYCRGGTEDTSWLQGRLRVSAGSVLVYAQIVARADNTAPPGSPTASAPELAQLGMAEVTPAGPIADQLKEFVHTFPDLDAGEKVLWMESLVERVEIAENRRVTALLRPPLCFGYLTTSPAPRGRRPQVPELRILVGYDLAVYYHAGAHGNASAKVLPTEARYSLVSESESVSTDSAENTRGCQPAATGVDGRGSLNPPPARLVARKGLLDRRMVGQNDE